MAPTLQPTGRKRQSIGLHLVQRDRQVVPTMARDVLSMFESGYEPNEIGRGIGGTPVVNGILRATLIAARSHNVHGFPPFMRDRWGREITFIPARKPMGKAGESRTKGVAA